MRMPNPYSALLVALIVTSCGIAPAPTTGGPNKKYSDLTNVVCANKGGDSDGDGICNADEIASPALGSHCVENTMCDGQTPDDERPEVASSGINPLWVLAGVVAGGVAESIWHPISNETNSWFRGTDQQITTAGGDVIKLKGRTIVSVVSKIQFSTTSIDGSNYPTIAYYTKTTFNKDVEGTYNGTSIKLNKDFYQCVIAKLAIVGSVGEVTPVQLQIPQPAAKQILYANAVNGFEDKCLYETSWGPGVYLSVERTDNPAEIKIRERSAKDLAYDLVPQSGIYQKVNALKFTDLGSLSSVKVGFQNNNVNVIDHLYDTAVQPQPSASFTNSFNILNNPDKIKRLIYNQVDANQPAYLQFKKEVTF